MNQVEIAKKILSNYSSGDGLCCGIKCWSDNCPFNNIGHCTLKVERKQFILQVKQWLKERESMIDLTKEQVLTVPVKCWVRDYDRDKWFPRWLVAVVNDGDDHSYYAAESAGHDAGHDESTLTILDAFRCGFCKWNQCVLIDPYENKVKKWLTVEDVPVELWCNALFKADEEPTYCAEVMSPNRCTDCDGKLFTDLVYLPQGQPLTGEWLPFESEE